MTSSRSWKQHQGPEIDSLPDYQIIDCKVCGFKHVVPLPDPAETVSLYEDEYYAEVKPYFIDRALEDREWWQSVYTDRLCVFETYLSAERRRVLDIGCGPGLFLQAGIQRGWEPVGIDPSAQAIHFCLEMGFDVYRQTLDSALAAELGRFDAVHLSEVLEHLVDPQSLLKLSRQILQPDGLICVVVPNDYNKFQLILREVESYEPWWLAPPHHLNYFSFSSIQDLVRRSGFEIVDVEATFPIDLFLLMGLNYVGDEETGRHCHKLRKQFEMVLSRSSLSETRRELYRAFARLGLGREVVVFARPS